MVVLFPDTTALINFGLCNQFDLLEELINGNGQWVGSVANEWAAQSQYHGIDNSNRVWEIFGEPIIPMHNEQAIHIQTQVYRDNLVAPGDGPTKHLGEAETLAVIQHGAFGPCFLATDDADVATHVHRWGISVKVVTTWQLLRFAYHNGFLARDEAMQIRDNLAQQGRAHFKPARSARRFSVWLEER